MKNALNALGYPVGRRRAQSLMKEAKVFVRYRKKYKVTTNSNHKQPVYENVLNFIQTSLIKPTYQILPISGRRNACFI